MSQLGYPKEFTPAVTKGFDPEVLKALKAYRAEYSLTQAALASELGCAEATVSKYLNEKPHGDVKGFEAVALDVIKSATVRKVIKIEIFGTSMSDKVKGACEVARKTNSFDIISGPAGIGKTCGAQSYMFANPSAILIGATVMAKTYPSIFNLIWSSIDTKWNGLIKKTTYLVNRFKGSNRLIIVDQAHRLRASGIEFLFDFHEETGCPVVLIGNPEIVDVLKENDQQFSRMGPHTEIKAKHINNPKDYAARMIKHFAPRFVDCLDLAVKIIEQRGHLRALRKTLILAEEFITSDAFRSKIKSENEKDLARTAFIQAHKHHIRDYEL